MCCVVSLSGIWFLSLSLSGICLSDEWPFSARVLLFVALLYLGIHSFLSYSDTCFGAVHENGKVGGGITWDRDPYFLFFLVSLGPLFHVLIRLCY